MAHKVMLLCGILSSLLYIGTDILGAVRYKDYSYTAQTISELSAIGAPTRSLVVPRFLAYAVLVIAFGVGVWRSAGPKQALRIVGDLLVGYEVVSLAGPFTPMHRREVLAADGVTLTDTLHKLGATVDTLFILLIIGFGATAFGRGSASTRLGASWSSSCLALWQEGTLPGLRLTCPHRGSG